jgi:hypothetical protein
MGRGEEDGMHNFRLLARRPDNDVSEKYHYAMLDITAGVVPHLDLVRCLRADETFRSESLYCSFFTNPVPTEPPFVVVSRASDLEDAELKARLAMNGAVDGSSYRATVNIGDGLALLKDKIEQYFGGVAAQSV